MAWETSLTNRREGGRNRTRDRKGTSEPEDPAHKREPLTERGFRALAEPRPVLRGLRRGGRRPAGSVRLALWLAEPRPVLRGLRHVRRRGGPHGGRQGLAEPRPVLRGLRPSSSCVMPRRARTALSLQSRDPFSGDCDAEALPGEKEGGRTSCRAETRSQGIATESFPADLPARAAHLAEQRPVLRGLRPG